MFQQSHDFVINDGDFRTYNHYGQSGIDILYEASSPGATMDSPEHYDRRCFPGTREQYISDITNWAAASIGTSPPIFWMRGPAGVGKSAIAQSCAENLRRAGHLGAAFFFTVGNNDNPLRLFTTMVYQLATVLPDFRALVDDRISKDKSIVKKRMSSQFELLIIEPLQELEEQGKGVGKRVIFIDGLDECADKASQVEIIEIIASSVQARSTPFRWAIFSREEPHIVSTFTAHNVSSHCYSVFLPISREADQDVELYLRGGFENILKRRNFLHLSSSWPTTEQICMLINAAGGLFAYPAAVLRFIDRHSYSGFKETLEAVLKYITEPGDQAISPYAELDGLYMLILQNVPGDILPSVYLLLAIMALEGYETWHICMLCNELGISETVFQSIYHHLQAVICLHPPPPYPLDEATADLARSCYDQEFSFGSNPQLQVSLLNVHGAISFYHKSFYDFLLSPTRSLTFCVTTPSVREMLFDRYIQQHHHYASSYVVQGSKVILAPSMVSSSASLFWPQGTEFMDSFLKSMAFLSVSTSLSNDGLGFGHFLEELPSSSLQKLAQLDYRKWLLAGTMTCDNLNLSSTVVAGHVGSLQLLPHTMFRSLTLYTFRPAVFFAMVEKLERLGIIRPYHPRFGSSRVASLLHSVSRHSGKKPSGKSYGCYKIGHGNRSVVWYWELDMEGQYFRDFKTVNYAEAMKKFKTEVPYQPGGQLGATLMPQLDLLMGLVVE